MSMPFTDITVDECCRHFESYSIVDVRSESEFLCGHIPEAENIPIFDNQQRATVGWLYQNKSKTDAILKGLEYAGEKLSFYVSDLQQKAHRNKILVYCWRGGMRSESMAGVFSSVGFDVYRLKEGYKAFRALVRKSFEYKGQFIVVGGYSGTGKTEILHQLSLQHCQTIDLEQLAHHKGSVFGSVDDEEQPSQEQFENNLFYHIRKLDPLLPVFIEDESRTIGSLNIPNKLFDNYCSSPMIFIRLAKEQRINRIIKEYSQSDKTTLVDGFMKISKRLGTQNTQKATEAIANDDFATAAGIALLHYDKAYDFSLKKRTGKCEMLDVENHQSERIALMIKKKFTT